MGARVRSSDQFGGAFRVLRCEQSVRGRGDRQCRSVLHRLLRCGRYHGRISGKPEDVDRPEERRGAYPDVSDERRDQEAGCSRGPDGSGRSAIHDSGGGGEQVRHAGHVRPAARHAALPAGDRAPVPTARP